MSILDDREEYLKNPFFEGHLYSDFTPFYIAISICSVLGVLIFIINIAFCCSRHKDYWKNRHTGNRYINTLWTATPHNNPPLDLSELESGVIKTYPQEAVQYHHADLERENLQSLDYMELQKQANMSLHIFWPASVCLTMFVVGVIMAMLKFGPKMCRLRHTPMPSYEDWERKSYSRELSDSIA